MRVQGMKCRESTFGQLNVCSVLMENFPCSACAESYGPDQPCYVETWAPEANVRKNEGLLLLFMLYVCSMFIRFCGYIAVLTKKMLVVVMFLGVFVVAVVVVLH